MSAEAIGFALRCSEAGWLLVAGGVRGVGWVGLGDDPRGLEAQLREERPRWVLRAGNGPVSDWAHELARRAAGAAPGLVVPLDLHGSAFQQRVWRAIRAIARGRTRSYGELASALGRPGAARAVASACAANPAALLVPCHRVVPVTKPPGGYRWGAARKRMLLEREGVRLRGTAPPELRFMGV